MIGIIDAELVVFVLSRRIGAPALERGAPDLTRYAAPTVFERVSRKPAATGRATRIEFQALLILTLSKHLAFGLELVRIDQVYLETNRRKHFLQSPDVIGVCRARAMARHAQWGQGYVETDESVFWDIDIDGLAVLILVEACGSENGVGNEDDGPRPLRAFGKAGRRFCIVIELKMQMIAGD